MSGGANSMLGILDEEELRGIYGVILPGPEYGRASRPEDCSGCAAYRPAAQFSGNLQVDPDTHLPSPGIDVDISFYYNGTSQANGPFGYGRTVSTNLTAQASGSPAIVTMTRGNGALVSFQNNGSGAYVPQTPGLLNTLVQDTVDGLWKETTPQGLTIAYPLNTTGEVTTVSWVADAVGNTHSMAYSSGLLQTLEDAVGRVVSFGYTAGGLLQTIEDWAGRITTFQYNTTLASPKNLLTTVTGPTGCQTEYQYATFTLSTFTNAAAYDWMLLGIIDPNGFATSYT